MPPPRCGTNPRDLVSAQNPWRCWHFKQRWHHAVPIWKPWVPETRCRPVPPIHGVMPVIFIIIKSITMLECVYFCIYYHVSESSEKMLLCKNITKMPPTTFTPPLGVWKNTTWQTLAARPKPPGGLSRTASPCNGGRSWVSLEPPGGKGGV